MDVTGAQEQQHPIAVENSSREPAAAALTSQVHFEGRDTKGICQGGTQFSAKDLDLIFFSATILTTTAWLLLLLLFWYASDDPSHLEPHHVGNWR